MLSMPSNKVRVVFLETCPSRGEIRSKPERNNNGGNWLFAVLSDSTDSKLMLMPNRLSEKFIFNSKYNICEEYGLIQFLKETNFAQIMCIEMSYRYYTRRTKQLCKYLTNTPMLIEIHISKVFAGEISVWYI